MKAMILVMLCLLLSACGAGSGEGLDNNGRPLDENPDQGTDDGTIQPTLTSIQAHVFSPICSVCHGGASPAAGQDLSTLARSAAALVNVQSSNPEFMRVLPGSPEQSYLYLKVTGDERAGARMPLGGDALDAEAIDAIRQWIADGAVIPGDGNVAARVSRVSIDQNSTTLDGRQLQLTFWFNQSMRLDVLSSEQVIVQVAKGKDRWTTMPVLAQISNPASNKLTVNISGIGPDTTKLRVILNQPSLSTVIATNGRVLDGDANGIDGGEYRYEYSF